LKDRPLPCTTESACCSSQGRHHTLRGSYTNDNDFWKVQHEDADCGLHYDTMYFRRWLLTFRINLVPPSSGHNIKTIWRQWGFSETSVTAYELVHSVWTQRHVTLFATTLKDTKLILTVLVPPSIRLHKVTNLWVAQKQGNFLTSGREINWCMRIPYHETIYVLI
jgi:hypothetical protein